MADRVRLGVLGLGAVAQAGIVEGRADIVTSQRIVARRALQTGLDARIEASA